MPGKKKVTEKEPKQETAVVTIAPPEEAQQVGTLIEDRSITAEETFGKLTRGQLALIKRTLAPGADNDELLYFINVCKGAGLNPFLRQAYFIKRWSAMHGKEVGQVQIGIDGYRAIAEGGGGYAGSDDAVFEKDIEVPVSRDPKADQALTVTVPNKATVTVYKIVQGVRVPFTATARWMEYEPRTKKGELSGLWSKMPYGQLAKCAEALALRKAFPKLLGGFYTPEEMAQAASVKPAASKTDMETAIEIVGRTTSVAELEDMEAKMSASEKYTKAEKSRFLKAVKARKEELQES